MAKGTAVEGEKCVVAVVAAKVAWVQLARASHESIGGRRMDPTNLCMSESDVQTLQRASIGYRAANREPCWQMGRRFQEPWDSQESNSGAEAAR